MDILVPLRFSPASNIILINLRGDDGIMCCFKFNIEFFFFHNFIEKKSNGCSRKAAKPKRVLVYCSRLILLQASVNPICFSIDCF